MRTSSGTILLAFLAVLVGLMGVYAVRKAGSRPVMAQSDARPDQVTVPLSSVDLKAGRTIALGDIALMRMTRAEMKKRGIKGPFMSSTSQIIGRTLKADLARGTTFDTAHFYPEGEGPNLATRLLPGQRAVTVAISDDNGLLGFAGPGQLVDLIFQVGEGDFGGHNNWHPRLGYHGYSHHNQVANGRHYGNGSRFTAGGNGYEYESYRSAALTLMQGVRVLALDKDAFEATRARTADPRDDWMRVTLAVSPEQAEVLRVVESNGSLSLTLRHPDDVATVDLVDLKTLEQVLHLKRIRNRGLEVYRGQRMNKIRFDGSSDLSRTTSEFGDRPAADRPPAARQAERFERTGQPDEQLRNPDPTALRTARSPSNERESRADDHTNL